MSLTAQDRTQNPPLPDYLTPIASELCRVDETISSELDSGVLMVREVTGHIFSAGGKRLRPGLVLLSGKACTSEDDGTHVIRVAAVAELIHMATLMHDDVIDDAESRRGRVTANRFWGNQVSVLTGDYMLARAFALLAEDGDIPVMKVLSQATVAMAEGEIRQIELRGDVQGLTEEYISIIAGKTAAFMSTCCRAGAICAHAPSGIEESLAEYGLNVGLAFQITDDLLDLVGDPMLTGKPVGGDLRDGKVTLPVILAMQRAEETESCRIRNILSSGNPSQSDFDYIQSAVEKAGAIEAARETASRYATKAINETRKLPPSPFRDALQVLAEATLHRKR